jgi:hypothetical protein
MTSERQIDANRRNAQKSTGPKTEVGKKQSSANAYRHGLTSRRPVAGIREEIEQLAGIIAGGSDNPIVVEWAHTAAEATLDLARVRYTKVILIDEMAAGHWQPLDVLQAVRSVEKQARLLIKWSKRYQTAPPEQDSPLNELPSQEPERTAEAVRRLLPDLRILDRYVRRAISRRNSALRKIQSNLQCAILAKRTQF